MLLRIIKEGIKTKLNKSEVYLKGHIHGRGKCGKHMKAEGMIKVRTRKTAWKLKTEGLDSFFSYFINDDFIN